MPVQHLTRGLKPKLYGFVLLAILLVFTLIVTGVYYYSSIEKANSTKADFNHLVKKLQDTRVVEKTYLQFFTSELKDQFGDFAQKTDQSFTTVSTITTRPKVKENLSSAEELFSNYKTLFAELVAIHEEHSQLKETMRQPLRHALMLINEIQSEIEEHQAELQMEGDDLSGSESEMMNVTRDSNIAILQLQNIQFQYLATGDEKFIQMFKDLADGAVKDDTTALHQFATALKNEKFLTNAREIQQSVSSFLGYIEQSQALGTKERQIIKETDLIGQKAIDPVETVLGLTNNIIDAQRKSAITTITTIVVVGILVFLGMSFFIVNLITKPLIQVVAGLKDIAEGEGDLTNRLTVKSRDEMGELAKWFNIFIEKIQALIRDMAQHAGRQQISSQELLGISENLSTGSEQTLLKANNMSEAGEQMSANMTSVAGAMSEAVENVSMIASAVEEMTATINEIAENTEKARGVTSEAVTQTEAASSQINELGEAAQDIGRVIETITEISEQVNLLALNATIEAARAGDAGKGFAVVANEIKELARQTASATNEIKTHVEGIQSSTQGTVGEMNRISEVVVQVNHIVAAIATAVEEQSVTTQEMAQNINQVSSGMEEVNKKVSESSTFTMEIAQETKEVMDASNEMSDNSAKVHQSSTTLSELAEEL
ncbi:MAG: methyl-accepting chemotaxis protein, partial [Desulfobulbaceae bacterium]|nr:methyl-accepting chemotaxis protein [Desulfobulbaceae bacterium]